MEIKWTIFALIFVMVACIAFSLFTGLYYLVHDESRGKRTLNALTLRITLSLAVFILLFAAFAMGWISPHGIIN